MNRAFKRRFYFAQLRKATEWAILTFIGAWAVNGYHLNKLVDAIDVAIIFFVVWSSLFILEAWWTLRKERKLHEPHT